MKRTYITIIMGIMLVLTANRGMAQTENTTTSWFKDKIEVGGNFAFNIGDRTGIVELSPTFSLRPIPKLITSLGLICQYSWDNKYTTSRFSYGFGLSARYTIISNMYVYAQYTYNPYIIMNELTEQKTTGTYSGLWLGAGYTKRISSKVTIYTGIVYDVLVGPHADDNPRISGGVSYQL